MQRNLLLKLAYDGTRYHGWQIQENAVTVQQVFQEALCKVTGRQEDLKACSRTDTGVHAREFCVSLKTESPIPEERLVAALNHYLPQDVAVRSCQRVGEDFHARYSCKGKEYCYEIWNHPVREPFLAGRALHYWYPHRRGPAGPGGPALPGLSRLLLLLHPGQAGAGRPDPQGVHLPGGASGGPGGVHRGG